MTQLNPEAAKPAPRRSRAVEKEIELNAPVEAVWKALTDGKELARWFPLEARVKPGVGGEVFLSWGEWCQGTGEIDVWEPNKRLRWLEPLPGMSEQGAPAHLAVEWTLEARGGKMILRLVNSGFSGASDWENEYYDGTDYGWTFMLLSLKYALEKHPGVARQSIGPRHKFAGTREQAFERLVAPGGIFRQAFPAGVDAGSRYSLRSAATDDALEGKIEFVRPPRGLCVSVENLNNALLWAEIFGETGKVDTTLWLYTYGLPEAQHAALSSAWNRHYAAIFADGKAAE